MINLLPSQNQFFIRREILKRFIIFFGLGASSLLIIQLFFLFSYYILVNSSIESSGLQLSYINQIVKDTNLESLEKDAAELNKLLSLFDKAENDAMPVSSEISKVLESQPVSVMLDFFSYNRSPCDKCKPSLDIAGTVETRDSLLVFISNLKRIGSFEQVESPIANLLAEKKVNFSATITLE